MEQRVSLITIGVRDLARTRAFYEGLGWTTRASPDDDIVFFQAGGMIVALWGRRGGGVRGRAPDLRRGRTRLADTGARWRSERRGEQEVLRQIDPERHLTRRPQS